MSRLAVTLAAILPFSAFAQTGQVEEPESETTSSQNPWSAGLAVSAKDSPYAGEGLRVQPFPLVTYQGERVYWVGVTLGVHLIKKGDFMVDAVVSGRFDGFDRGDLGRMELAENGVDIDQLADRDHAADAGIAVRWRTERSELHIRALADVTGTSKGHELSADYGYRLHAGKTTIIPGIGIRWLSDDLANYYYGVRSSETFTGTAYQPGSAVVPEIGVAFIRPFANDWRLHGLVKYQGLPGALADSPLLEKNAKGTAQIMVGISRSF